MQIPSAQVVLAAWEAARPRSPGGRAVVLLSAMIPKSNSEELAALSLGRRDALLLEMRQALFGDSLSATSACPGCGEKVQMDFDVRDILLTPAPESISQKLSLETQGYSFSFRLPTGLDLDAISNAPNGQSATRQLLARCVHRAVLNDRAIEIDELNEKAIAAIGQEMARADPQAEIRLSLVCPACGHGWAAPFDPLTYLWTELEAWSMRTLHEVHQLARKYGWREADILAMTPMRRRIYLEMSDG